MGRRSRSLALLGTEGWERLEKQRRSCRCMYTLNFLPRFRMRPISVHHLDKVYIEDGGKGRDETEGGKENQPRRHHVEDQRATRTQES